MTHPTPIAERLRALADCDARAGEPLGICMREAADHIEHLERTNRELSEALERISRGKYDGLEVTHMSAFACRHIAREALGLEQERQQARANKETDHG